MSQSRRAMIGWGKQHGTMRKTKHRAPGPDRCPLLAQSDRLQLDPKPRRCWRASAVAGGHRSRCWQPRSHLLHLFTDGSRELFDCAGQGRVDVFVLFGGQIDGKGSINLVTIGDYQHPKVRFPGSFGSAYLYYVAPKVFWSASSTRAARWCPKSISSARRAVAPKMSFAPAARSHWSPTAVCSISTARGEASALPACIPDTASPK